MLRFFRNIRQKLILQENIRKYLLYALGEIMLVVIGILIALQINNWNEVNKDRAYELKMLSEINRDLQSEINRNSNGLRLFSEIDFSLNELLKMRTNSEYPRDSLHVHLDNLRSAGLFFPYSDGAYEALKSGGLDKISNNELRMKLVRLYDYYFVMMAIFTNELARPSMIEKFTLFDQVFPVELSPGDEGMMIESYDYSNFEEVVQTAEFMDLLKSANEFVPSVKSRLDALLRQMKEVQQLLDEELQN
jgi:hypothetical protein